MQKKQFRTFTMKEAFLKALKKKADTGKLFSSLERKVALKLLRG